jgi:uncharacterized paraquat-inducible protein A
MPYSVGAAEMAKRLKSKGLQCPMCEQIIVWRQLKAQEPFECPHCKEVLRIPRAYLKLTGLIDFVLALGLSWFVGARGVWLVVTVGAGFFSIGFLTTTIESRVWPPTLEVVPPGERYT